MFLSYSARFTWPIKWYLSKGCNFYYVFYVVTVSCWWRRKSFWLDACIYVNYCRIKCLELTLIWEKSQCKISVLLQWNVLELLLPGDVTDSHFPTSISLSNFELMEESYLCIGIACCLKELVLRMLHSLRNVDTGISLAQCLSSQF